MKNFSEVKPTLLIVDDEPISIEMLRNMMEKICTVLSAKNGKEALEVFAKHDIDMVVMDVQLPDGTGFDICRRFKQMKSENIPVIFVSGHSDLLFEIQAFDAGAVDFLNKPVSPVRVLMRMNVHLHTNFKFVD